MNNIPQDTVDKIKHLPFKKYSIKKGKNYDNFNIPKFHFGIDNWSVFVIFTESCLYDQLEPEDDLNKLWGYSYGYHKKNSFRIAWRPCRTIPNTIELYYYIYHKRLRYTKLITKVYINQPYLIEVTNRISSNVVTFPRVSVGTYMGISDKMTNDIVRLNNVLDVPICLEKKWGYELGLYFGGNNNGKDTVAPHDMVFYLLK